MGGGSISNRSATAGGGGKTPPGAIFDPTKSKSRYSSFPTEIKPYNTTKVNKDNVQSDLYFILNTKNGNILIYLIVLVLMVIEKK